jgi:hypothetical protein
MKYFKSNLGVKDERIVVKAIHILEEHGLFIILTKEELFVIRIDDGALEHSLNYIKNHIKDGPSQTQQQNILIL